MDKIAFLLAVVALVLAVLNAVDLHLLRGKVEARTNPAQPSVTAAALPDPWADAIRTWLDTTPPVPLTPDAILAGALPGTASTRAASARITAVMKTLGYRATRVRLPEQEALTRVFQPAPGTVVSAQP